VPSATLAPVADTHGLDGVVTTLAVQTHAPFITDKVPALLPDVHFWSRHGSQNTMALVDEGHQPAVDAAAPVGSALAGSVHALLDVHGTGIATVVEGTALGADVAAGADVVATHAHALPTRLVTPGWLDIGATHFWFAHGSHDESALHQPAPGAPAELVAVAWHGVLGVHDVGAAIVVLGAAGAVVSATHVHSPLTRLT
jgi:hypothetical protein